MIENEINKMFTTTSKLWDKQIAFSPNDIASMLNIPKSTITRLIREGYLKAFKVGRQYRITRMSLYRFIQNNECYTLL